MRMTTSLSDMTRILAISFLFLAVAGSSGAGDLETDGAFVSTKTSGPPLAVSGTDVAPGLNADTLDGLEGSSLPRSPANIITVGESGANFSSVEQALGSITDASAGNQYLISIGPGNFDSFAEDGLLILPGHIHLVGSGPEVTTLKAGLLIDGPTRISSLFVDEPTRKPIELEVQSSAWIDRVRIRSDNGIFCSEDATLSVEETSIEVSPFVTDSGIYGIRSFGCSVRLREVTIEAQGGSVLASNSVWGLHLADLSGHHPTLEASDISILVVGGGDRAYGVQVIDAKPGVPVRIENSTIELLNSNSLNSVAVYLSENESTEILRSSVKVSGPGVGVQINADFVDEVVNIRWTEIVADEDAALETDSSGDGIVATVLVDHSEVRGSPVLRNESTGDDGVGWFRHSHLDGDLGGNNVKFFCKWVTDETFATFDKTCP